MPVVQDSEDLMVEDVPDSIVIVIVGRQRRSSALEGGGKVAE